MLRKINLADQAYEELVKKIVSGAYPAGETLPEEKLTAEFGISRTPVREALRRLAAEGLIEPLPRGFRVALPDEKALRELFECRCMLELQALKRAIGRIPAEKTDGLLAALRQCTRGKNARKNALAADQEMHALIRDYCGNRCLAALIEQGKLGFDDPVTKWLPYFTPALADGSVPVITIRQLLCHMSGLDYRWSQTEDGPYARAGVSDGLDITGLSLEENLRRLASAPLRFAPGSDWLYSLAPDVLGAVIGKAYGTGFEAAMAELVLKPLGMSDTVFHVSPADRERVAAPYYLDNGVLTRMAEDQYLTDPEGRYFHFSPERVFKENEYPSGGVGLTGTAADLMRMVEAIRTKDAPFADKKLMTQMAMNQLPTGKEARPGIGFCLGWGVLVDPVAADNTPQAPGTLAWGGVYGSKWFADPSIRLSVVTMTTTALDEVVAVDIRNAIYASFGK